MNNKLIAVGLMLVLMWPLMAADKKSVDHYNGLVLQLSTQRGRLHNRHELDTVFDCKLIL